GIRFSGISIFSGGAPQYVDGSALALGDRMQVDGDFTEFNGVTQLSNPAFVKLSDGAPLEPELVDIAVFADDATAEPYEGVLIRIASPTVTDENPDAPDDFDEFEVDGTLRVDDGAFDGLDNTYALNTQFAQLIGVVHYSFGNFKLLPRGADDLQLPTPE
ncbi:MAG: hypothetical protein AAGA56_03435, partial [Myxococcota bacterium]